MDTEITPQPSPEQNPGVGVESTPQPIAPENSSNISQNNTGQPQQMVQAAPKQALTAADVTAAMAAVSKPAVDPVTAGMPEVAADQDAIEPEWVEKAEQVVTATAGNPYEEEEGIEALQIDYLKKRYGFEVKKPDDK